jgi:endonuclease/exonuclease/phosphatase family metal-dependent hydrolase
MSKYLTLLGLVSLCWSVAPSSPAQASERLRVATYNVWGLPKPLSEDPKGRLRALCSFLKQQAPEGARPDQRWDVLLLQEVWKPWMAEGLRHCGYPHSVRLDEGAFETGLMILSIHPLSRPRRHIFKTQPSGWDAFWKGESISTKGVLTAVLEHPTFGPVLVANTHVAANYGPSMRFEDERRSQLIEAAEFIEGHEVGGLPRTIARIIGGDFNVAPEGSSYTLLWEELGWILPEFRRFVPLLPVSTRSRTNPYSDEEEGQLDHLFALSRGAQGLVPVSGRVVFNGTHDTFSDHYGWETVFSKRAPGPDDPDAEGIWLSTEHGR